MPIILSEPPPPGPYTSPLAVEVGAAYTIIGPDGTRAVVNAPDDPDHVGFLLGESGVTGLERAGVRESADTLPEADGGVHGSFWYDRLAFTLQGFIDHRDDTSGGRYAGLSEAAIRAQRIARLMRATNAMRADAELRWTPSTAPEVRVLFRQQQPTRITGRRPKQFLVAGVAELNVVESRTLRTAGGELAAFEWDDAGGRTHTDYRAEFDATNDGGALAWPVLRIYAPVPGAAGELRNPVAFFGSVTIPPAGGPAAPDPGTTELRLAPLTLADGLTELVIDTDPRERTIKTVRSGVTTNVYDALDWSTSVWGPIDPGTTPITVETASGSQDSGGSPGWRAELTWRDTYG